VDDEETRKFSQGYIILLFGGPIVWKVLKQSIISINIIEAKMVALAIITREAMAFYRFYKKLHLDLGECWKIYCDNQQTIRLITNDQMRITTILKHINIQNMWLKQKYAKDRFIITYLSIKKC
jgi:hypothetical protein